jgi:F0F1-type ATP synthase assembly protein I
MSDHKDKEPAPNIVELDPVALKDLDEEQLIELDKKIRDAQDNNNKNDKEQSQLEKDADTGKKAGIEFGAHVIAGGLIGYFIDHFLDTLPLFFMLMMAVGFVSGIYRSYLIMNEKI